MKQKKEKRISTLTQQFTSTISVTLVILILGIVISLGIMARQEMDAVRENLGLNIVLKENTSDEDVEMMKRTFENLPYITSFRYITPDEILAIEEKEIGENIIELLGANPYPGEFEVKLIPEYANNDSITAISSRLAKNPAIDEIISPTDTVANVNRTFSTLTIILSVVALALLVISFVLINNTVWLTIYSRRFLIHTMRLVGATPGFIRRPILINNMVNGAIAGSIASLAMAALRFYSTNIISETDEFLPWSTMGIIFGVMIVGGILICLLASYLATEKYLRKSYDDLF